MTELNLQKMIYKELTKKFSSTSLTVLEEQANLSGCTDLLIHSERTTFVNAAIEIKLKPNSQLIKQLIRQKLRSTHLIAITQAPVRESTRIKWMSIAIKNNINLIYWTPNHCFENILNYPNPAFDRYFYNGTAKNNNT